MEHITQKSKALAGLKINKDLGGDKKKSKVVVQDLIDARHAGKKESALCALFITEGLPFPCGKPLTTRYAQTGASAQTMVSSTGHGPVERHHGGQ